MQNKALILVDFENEWTLPDSDYYVGDISDTIEKTNKVIDFARKNDYKIIFIQHIEKEGDSFAEGTDRVEIINTLHQDTSDISIKKYKISPFYKTDLEHHLEGIKSITVCGILTNLCVRSLIQDTYDRDFGITVIKDCCVSLNDEIQQFTFKDIKETREEIDFVEMDNFLNV